MEAGWTACFEFGKRLSEIPYAACDCSFLLTGTLAPLLFPVSASRGTELGLVGGRQEKCAARLTCSDRSVFGQILQDHHGEAPNERGELPCLPESARLIKNCMRSRRSQQSVERVETVPSTVSSNYDPWVFRNEAQVLDHVPDVVGDANEVVNGFRIYLPELLGERLRVGERLDLVCRDRREVTTPIAVERPYVPFPREDILPCDAREAGAHYRMEVVEVARWYRPGNKWLVG